MTDTTNTRMEAARGDGSPESLEREVSAERARVAATIDALQDKMSIGNILDDVVRSFSRYGGDMAGNLGRQVRQNPLPLLLTGVGLAWLMTSSSRSRSRYQGDEYLWEADDDFDDDLYDEDFAGTRHYSGAPVRPYGTAGVAGTYEPEESGALSSAKGAAGSAASRAGGAAGSAASGAGRVAGSVTSGVGDAAGSAAAGAGRTASGAGHAAGSAARGVGRAAGAVGSGIGSAASGAAGAISSGARGFTHGARSAGGSVRDGAYRARQGAYEAGRHSMRRADEMIQEHPLVMGALALALGAAIGGALPRTRTEDEYIGSYSDQAKDAARTTVARESDKARRVAGAVADEARNVYDEKSEEVDRRLKDAANEGRSLADRAKTEATSTAERLRDTARSEAERQHLGDPNKSA